MKTPRRILQVISWVACFATILPSLLYLLTWLDEGAMKATMLVATIVWFIATPLWMGREQGALEANEPV